MEVSETSQVRVHSQVEPTELVQRLQRNNPVEAAAEESSNPLLSQEDQQKLETEENESNFLATVVVIGAVAVGAYLGWKWISRRTTQTVLEEVVSETAKM